jgi:L-alanine-DL-glutamate epimerase-like enolase superfamily enzyme
VKISNIETTMLTVPVHDVRWSGGEATAVPATLIQLFTDDGVSGLGDVYCGALAPGVIAPLVDHFRPHLLGLDPTNVQAAWRAMYGRSLFWGRSGVALAVMSAIENALWDVAGKAAGVPVHELLGGVKHERLLVYASGGLDKPEQEFANELLEYKRIGLRAVKIRIGHGVERDRERVRFAREVLGPGFTIMVDAVQGHNPEPWGAETAIAVAKAIEQFDITWFEEPCAATEPEAYCRVRAATSIPIAGGESCTSMQEFKAFFDTDALAIVQPDVSHAGGILGCRAIAEAAQKRNVKLAPHSWGTGAMLAATYHFGFATQNCTILEYPTWGHALRDELMAEPFDIRDGYMHPAKSPGLGIELRQETIDKYPYKPGAQPTIRRTTAGGRA